MAVLFDYRIKGQAPLPRQQLRCGFLVRLGGLQQLHLGFELACSGNHRHHVFNRVHVRAFQGSVLKACIGVGWQIIAIGTAKQTIFSTNQLGLGYHHLDSTHRGAATVGLFGADGAVRGNAGFGIGWQGDGAAVAHHGQSRSGSSRCLRCSRSASQSGYRPRCRPDLARPSRICLAWQHRGCDR